MNKHENLLEFILFCLFSNTSMQEFHAAIKALTKEVEKVQGLEDKLQAMTFDLEKANHELAAWKTQSEPYDKVEKLEKIIQSRQTENEPGTNELFTWFAHREKGPGAHKWSTYLDAYHQHYNRFRTQDKITMVEVGVQSGGSIEMWQLYFGADKLK